jgi:acyl-CoA synthetase (AMP-forming)/AMP-acid ligase II/acyl carrier protein
VALVSRETAADGEALRVALEETHATTLQATPVTWRLLLAAGWRPMRPFRALCGGEAFPPDLAQALCDVGVELWNMYGPTETTVWSTIHRVERADSLVPVGRPIANTQLYILNAALQPQPVGVAGELYIGGEGVARGYLNRPELTAERFIRDPFRNDAQARIYRTGDLARYRPDGTVEVLGRTDHQVKIRGFRIELGEIESVLREHDGVGDAVVVDLEAPSGGRRLVAYLTAAGERAPTSSDLRRHLRSRLPDYMVPALFVTLNVIPRTPNGKTDRKALPAPERERVSAEPQIAAPNTETERIVAQIWSEALGVERVGLYDNFFDLGGHSLLAVETMVKLEQQTGVKLNPVVVRTQTLGQLAAMVEELQGSSQPAQPKEKETERLADRMRGAFRRVLGSRES